VALTNGAQACNVYWKVTSSATIGTTSAIVGNILALISITMNTGASLTGRAMAQTGAVTLDTNVITRAVCATPGAGAGSSPPPTSTSGSQESDSSPTPPILLVFVGLAAAAAWVTLKRVDPDRE
jgi:hypothetical protein